MTTLLCWSSPNRQDRKELPSFTCTEKGRKRQHAGRWEVQHPRPWEVRLQACIRRCKPPRQPPDFALVGRDDEGIGAAVLYEEVDGPAMVEVHAVAVALRLRGKGGGWADEMMRTLFDALTTRAMEHGVDAVGVLTWIHEMNHGSQRLARRHGLAHTGRVMDGDPRLQRWAAQVLVGGAELPAT